MPQFSDSTDPLLPTPVSAELNEQGPKAPFGNMGVSQSTARIMAPAAFFLNFGCQMYGMMSSPNMLDIHNKNPCSFSPHPFAIGGFFSMQQIAQLLWLRELYRSDNQVEQNTLQYVPWFSLGNASIAIWMLFWNSDNLKGSLVPVLLNSSTQLYYCFALRNKVPSTYQSKLTNIVALSFAGIGVLDVFHNLTAAFYPNMAPNTLVKVATTIAAPLTVLSTPLLFAASVAWDIFGVAVGQHTFASKAVAGMGGGGGEGWARWLGGLGVGTVGIIAARAYSGAPWL